MRLIEIIYAAGVPAAGPFGPAGRPPSGIKGA